MNSWDHHLLRKFSSTSHFRLMNQVRSELRTHPLKRNELTRVLSIETKPSATYNSRENKRYLYNQTDISAVLGWGFLDVSAACAPMDENDYQKLLDFGIEREKLINQVIKETFGVTTGIKDISGLSDEMEGSIRLIYPSPEMAPPDGLGRRRRRRRRRVARPCLRARSFRSRRAPRGDVPRPRARRVLHSVWHVASAALLLDFLLEQ